MPLCFCKTLGLSMFASEASLEISHLPLLFTAFFFAFFHDWRTTRWEIAASGRIHGRCPCTVKHNKRKYGSTLKRSPFFLLFSAGALLEGTPAERSLRIYIRKCYFVFSVLFSFQLGRYDKCSFYAESVVFVSHFFSCGIKSYQAKNSGRKTPR